MQNDQTGAVVSRQRKRHAKSRSGRLRQVRREKDRPDRRHDGACLDRKHRTRCTAENLFSHAPKEQSPQAAAPVRPDDDQAGLNVVSGFEDFLGCVAVCQSVFHAHICIGRPHFAKGSPRPLVVLIGILSYQDLIMPQGRRHGVKDDDPRAAVPR